MSDTPGIFNVLDPPYNAAGDGVTDDTVAIQSAINAAYVAGGGIVYLPKGRYLINGNMLMTERPSAPGGHDGTYNGTTAIPIIPGTTTQFPLTGIDTNNKGKPHAGVPTMLPNGPLLLFDNVTLQGDGPDITFVLAGENIYGGYMLAPAGAVGTATQSGVVIANVNWWADYLSKIDPFPNGFPDGFYAHNVFIKDLTVDCQGQYCTYEGQVLAGQPLYVIEPSPTPVSIPNVNAPISVDGNPIGQLTGVAITLQDVQNCGVSNVWVYDGNVNGILIQGTQNLDAHANGPITQSYEQNTGTVELLPDLEVFVPNQDNSAPFGKPNMYNIPFVNGAIIDCRVDMNYPIWLAGTRSLAAGGGGGHGYTGGSNGQLPIRCVGAAGMIIARNRVGQRNQPSAFPTPPEGTVNFPNVGPNTNDAMDCPGCWHIQITNNILTNCGDGIGAAGNGNMVIADNVLYNFGSNGVDMIAPANNNPNEEQPSTAKGPSQTVIRGNVFFLSSDSGSPQQAINYNDLTDNPYGHTATSGLLYGSGNEFVGGGGSGTPEQASSQQGCLIIANNIFYASNISTFCALSGWGIIVTGNIFDYAGNTPWGQPLAVNEYHGDATSSWPYPRMGMTVTGVNVKGNDILIEGNIFRNAGQPGTSNSFAVGITFPMGFPPPLVPGDTVRVLIKGNSFDPTIGVPISAVFTSTPYGAPRVIDNLGINPGAALIPAVVPLVPITGTTFKNPYIFDCFVNVSPAVSTVTVMLNGTPFGSIAVGQQRAFLVKAGGSITLTYTGAQPSWEWVAL